MKEISFENKASASFIIDPFVLPTSVTITSSRKWNDASLCNSFFVSSTGEAKQLNVPLHMHAVNQLLFHLLRVILLRALLVLEIYHNLLSLHRGPS